MLLDARVIEALNVSFGKQGGDADIELDYHMRLPASDAEEIEDLFDSSCAFRMAQTLVDWLEKRYDEEKCSSNTASLHAFK